MSILQAIVPLCSDPKEQRGYNDKCLFNPAY
jgi:hypothetical protein